MPFLRQRQQILGQKKQLFHPNGKLARLGSKKMAAHTNQIAEIEQFIEFKPSLTDYILLYVDLNALSGPLQVRKSRLTHQAHREDSASDANFTVRSLQIRAGSRAKLGGQIGNSIGPTKFVWIGSQAQRLNLLQFFLTLLKLLARLKFQRENPFQCRWGV